MHEEAVGETPEFSINPALYQALHLAERSEEAFPTSHDRGEQPNQKAQTRLMRWKKIPVFAKEDFFQQRLAKDKLTENDLFYLLAEEPQMLKARLKSPPEWLIRLDADLRQFQGPSATLATFLESSELDSFQRACLKLSQPWLDGALARLETGLDQLYSNYSRAIPVQKKTLIDLLLGNLTAQLPVMFVRTLALEVNLARLKGQLDRAGESSEARFERFVEQLTRPDSIKSFFEEYCVLARLVQTRVDQWAAFSLEFCRQFLTDWPVLFETFFANNSPGNLVELEGGVGDRHRGGRGVLILKFETGQKLVYKPHSLSLDRHFQQLLGWLNTKISCLEPAQPLFHPIKILDRGSYGWSEFVEAKSCANRAEVHRFYERQGAYLALLYALEAIDFHFENLIASGEHPVLIDLEALFHPRPSAANDEIFQDAASAAYYHSLARTGLLPERIYSTEDKAGVDMSGLGSRAGQLSTKQASFVKGLGTDQMRLERKHFELETRSNQPKLNGKTVDAIDYLENVSAGFSRMYRLLLQVRLELLEGHLQMFEKDEVRVIMRATMHYDRLLQENYHPNYLRDALDCERIYDRLWAAVEWQPELTRLIGFEGADLWRGDIPYFYTHVNSRDLIDSQGRPVPDFLAESGFEATRKHIQHLSESDMESQLWLIGASFATIPTGTAESTWKTSNLSLKITLKVDQQELVELAGAIGERLVKLAFQQNGQAGWQGLSLVKEREWVAGPVGPDLYNGNSGIALFLAYLGKVTQNETFTQVARAALKTIRYQLDNIRRFSKVLNVGGYSENMSVVYLYSHLATLWNAPEFLDEAEALLVGLDHSIETDTDLDVLDGTAGCLAVLLDLYRVRPSRVVLETAIKCGEHLVRMARPFENSQEVAWNTAVAGVAPLVGFGHGSSGISYNLLRLAILTGRTDFKHTALAALAYEQRVFSKANGNWPDFRLIHHNQEDKESSLNPGAMDNLSTENEIFREKLNAGGLSHFTPTWCHGAPGIGLARSALRRLVDYEWLGREIESALKITGQRGFGFNHSLSHGDMGSLELFLAVTQNDPSGICKSELTYHLERLVANIKTQGWICGTPLGVETPGLMTGLAGVGYGLLRLARPEILPSVLLLEQ